MDFTKEKLKKHNIIVHQKKMFQKCDTIFSKRGNLTKHKVIVNEKL